MAREGFFAKIETNRAEQLYIYVEFEAHVLGDKNDFPYCKVTLLPTTTFKEGLIYTTPSVLTSKQCLNDNLEWSYAYFKKLRSCLRKKFADVVFVFSQEPGNEIGCDAEVSASSFCSCKRSSWSTTALKASQRSRCGLQPLDSNL